MGTVATIHKPNFDLVAGVPSSVAGVPSSVTGVPTASLFKIFDNADSKMNGHVNVDVGTYKPVYFEHSDDETHVDPDYGAELPLSPTMRDVNVEFAGNPKRC